MAEFRFLNESKKINSKKTLRKKQKKNFFFEPTSTPLKKYVLYNREGRTRNRETPFKKIGTPYKKYFFFFTKSLLNPQAPFEKVRTP
jgi:hypothetical protein